MSTLLILAYLYLFGSVISTLYVLFCHFSAVFTYFRRLFTAKKLNTNEITTYFGSKFHDGGWSFEDHWCEVLLISSLNTFVVAIFSFTLWPLLSLILLNSSINKARERIQKDS